MSKKRREMLKDFLVSKKIEKEFKDIIRLKKTIEKKQEELKDWGGSIIAGFLGNFIIILILFVFFIFIFVEPEKHIIYNYVVLFLTFSFLLSFSFYYFLLRGYTLKENEVLKVEEIEELERELKEMETKFIEKYGENIYKILKEVEKNDNS